MGENQNEDLAHDDNDSLLIRTLIVYCNLGTVAGRTRHRGLAGWGDTFNSQAGRFGKAGRHMRIITAVCFRQQYQSTEHKNCQEYHEQSERLGLITKL